MGRRGSWRKGGRVFSKGSDAEELGIRSCLGVCEGWTEVE